MKSYSLSQILEQVKKANASHASDLALGARSATKRRSGKGRPRTSSRQPVSSTRLMLIIAKIERRPVNLNLADYPYLPAANVKTTSAADYMVLISGRAA